MITTLDIILSLIIGTYLFYLGFRLIDKDWQPLAVYAFGFAGMLYMIGIIGIIQKVNLPT